MRARKLSENMMELCGFQPRVQTSNAISNKVKISFFVQVKTNRIYIIVKFSAHIDDFINNVQIFHKTNNHKEIYFCNSKRADPIVRIDSVESLRRNYHDNTGRIIGEIYVKFDTNEVNVHLDIANDPQVHVIPSRSNTDLFSFVYRNS